MGAVGLVTHYSAQPTLFGSRGASEFQIRHRNALTEKAWKDAVHQGTRQGIVHTSWDPSAEANCDGNIK